RIYSPLFTQHLAVMRSSPVVRDLVFSAYDDAVSAVGEQLMKNLTGTLTAACVNPEIMLRPRTEPELDLSSLIKKPEAQELTAPEPAEPAAKRGALSRSEAKGRVLVEMRRRSGPSGGLPPKLQDRVFDPKDVKSAAPLVALKLQRAFNVLAGILATQAYAFADASLATLCRRQVDEAMNGIDFNAEQRRVLEDRHTELQEVASQVEGRLAAVQRCLTALRAAR
ncbi:unnamed protein product, partial [Effrenium voratum]